MSDDDSFDLAAPKLVPASYDKQAEAAGLLRLIADKFRGALPQPETHGFVPAIKVNEQEIIIRITHEDKVIYALNFFYSDLGDTTIGYNFDAHPTSVNHSAHSGSIEPVYDKAKQVAAFKLNTFTNAPDLINIGSEQVISYFWKDLTAKLEKLEAGA